MARKEFSLFKDWNRIYWKDTIRLNFARAVCVTPIIFIVFLVAVIGGGDSPALLLIALLWPVLYFVFVPFIMLFFSLLFIVFGDICEPLIWIFFYWISLFVISLGDPILFLLRKRKPNLVPPVNDFRFINFKLVLFVYEKENRRNEQEEMMDSDY